MKLNKAMPIGTGGLHECSKMGQFWRTGHVIRCFGCSGTTAGCEAARPSRDVGLSSLQFAGGYVGQPCRICWSTNLKHKSPLPLAVTPQAGLT
jgi:hypothetical protein